MPNPTEQRSQRLDLLEAYIRGDCKGKTTLKDIYVFALRNWRGLTTRTVNSYLHDLELLGLISRNGDHITIKEKQK